MRRRIRSTSAWLALFALLFAQLVTAAYACPEIRQPAPAVQSPECDHDRNSNPNLCQRHCDEGKASLDSPRLAAPPDMVATFDRPMAIAVVGDAPRVAPRAQVPTGPPATRFTVLRI